MILIALAVVTATPASLPAALAAAQPGDRIVLAAGDYAPVAIRKRDFAPGITIDARKASVAGVNIDGSSGIRWVGGTVRAPGGLDGFAATGYAFRVVDARAVTIQGASITAANRGVALAGGQGIVIRGNRFAGLREDGIIATRTAGLTIAQNSFGDFKLRPSACTSPGEVTYGIAKWACAAKGGVWKDGNHGDAIQIYNGITGAMISGNSISGTMQGIGQMDGPADAPMERVTISGNRVATSVYHSISLARCTRCRITGNEIISLTPGRRTPVRFTPPGTIACGNTGAAEAEAMKPCN